MKKDFPKIEEMRPRDYTVVGITALIHKFVSKDSVKVFGREFKDLVSVVKNGQFYHGEAIGDRQGVSESFLKKVNANKVNLNLLYRNFNRKALEYEKLLALPTKKYSTNTIKQFYAYYCDLIDAAYGAMETLDFIKALKPSKHKTFTKWATKTRMRAERIYKDGEHIFVPKYLKWFSSKFAPLYPAELLQYLFYKEFLDFIDGKKQLPSLKELKQRQKYFYVRQYSLGKYELASGKAAQKIIKQRGLFNQKIDKKIREIKGAVAYTGLARGKVRIIISRKDLHKFKKGEIIVSPMTDPSYLPIMKQSPAFVTDEGGVLCHAAIVARELKKPCVIGTKHATKVFKDGDLVEVDANNGTVKKI